MHRRPVMKDLGARPGFFCPSKGVGVKKLEVYHIVFQDDVSAWKVEKDGAPWPIEQGEGKLASVRAAKNRARSAAHAEVIIHRKDGTVQERCTYGRDPTGGLT